MLTFMQHLHSTFMPPARGALSLLFFAVFAGAAFGQTTAGLPKSASAQDVRTAAATSPQPVASIYKELKLGTSADEVRKILGKAEIDDKDGFFYDNDSETVQIRIDEAQKVRLISVTYSSESPNAPKYADIFGSEPTDAKPDGSIYRLVRYPEAGYWIAYSKTAGKEPSVTVTMQKF